MNLLFADNNENDCRKIKRKIAAKHIFISPPKKKENIKREVKTKYD